jgi:putative Ca2+/H+ antiporter (TMEM165/GDT1 family)
MSLWLRPLAVTQNEDYSTFWGYANGPIGASTPFSFAGATALLTVSELADRTSLTLLGLSSGAGQLVFGTTVIQGITFATITATIPSATTLGLPAGDWYYNLLVTIAGLNTYYADGPFTVVPSVG